MKTIIKYILDEEEYNFSLGEKVLYCYNSDPKQQKLGFGNYLAAKIICIGRGISNDRVQISIINRPRGVWLSTCPWVLIKDLIKI